MDFDFSQEQRLLQDSTRDFIKRECPTTRVRELMATETAHDDALWNAMAEQGWTGMTIPEEMGGLGLSFVDLAVVMEEMGRAPLPGPFFSNFWGTALLMEVGTASQQKELLEPIAAGEKKVTVAWLEPGANWNPDSLKLKADEAGDNVKLTGKKRFVTDANSVDTLLVVCRMGNGFAVVPVARTANGVTITPTPSMDDTRKLADVTFKDCLVNRSSVLTVKDAAALERANDFAATALGAELVGGMQLLMEMTLGYAHSRQQFDRPIGVFQATQHQCADMLLYTESARSAAYHAAWALAEKIPSAPKAAAVAKAYIAEAARRVANHACQVHGGIGFTWEHDLHLYYKRAKFSEVFLGDPGYHKERVAEWVLDRELVGEL